MSPQVTPEVRGSGRTLRQLQNMKKGGLFIWATDDLSYVLRLMNSINSDAVVVLPARGPMVKVALQGPNFITVAPFSYLLPENFHRLQGMAFPDLVVDHAALERIHHMDRHSELLDHLQVMKSNLVRDVKPAHYDTPRLVEVLQRLDQSLRRLYLTAAQPLCDEAEGAFGELIVRLSKTGVVSEADASALVDAGQGLETRRLTPEDIVTIVYKDGSTIDSPRWRSWEYENDPEWLTTIDLGETRTHERWNELETLRKSDDVVFLAIHLDGNVPAVFNGKLENGVVKMKCGSKYTPTGPALVTAFWKDINLPPFPFNKVAKG